jgi:hypothetical protein
LQAGDDPRAIQQKVEDGVGEFVKLRQKYLLYR